VAGKWLRAFRWLFWPALLIQAFYVVAGIGLLLGRDRAAFDEVLLQLALWSWVALAFVTWRTLKLLGEGRNLLVVALMAPSPVLGPLVWKGLLKNACGGREAAKVLDSRVAKK
jgi:hypothetical protein